MNLTQTSDRRQDAASRYVVLDETLAHREARDLLSTLLETTIDNYKLQSLSSSVHTNSSDQNAEQQIVRLQAASADVRSLVDEARQLGLRLRIRSTVELVPESEFGFNAS